MYTHTHTHTRTHTLTDTHTLTHTHSHSHTHSHARTHTYTHTHTHTHTQHTHTLTHTHTHTHTQGVRNDNSICTKIAGHIPEHISTCDALKNELRSGGSPSICGDNICHYFRWFYPNHYKKCQMKGRCVCVWGCVYTYGHFKC